ncbi:diguanylate cyclase [Sulfurimonas aquatica]|uniref:diguanylate cyclase n=1 Tax=Sulfurimonas aquatica TaxID=2672570 RepID=A0A975B286_9BACT|nr:GGDEF domain-containing protein [Sulfurimonas aquatica]QSZ42793.1 diguanylate cyclase [Sulfurimonas aquatica]
MNILSLQRSITLKYVVALLLIALLSSASFYVLFKALEESKNTAYIVNISGKQRMLSQHIALALHRLHKDIEDSKINEGIVHNNILVQTLMADIKEMSEANRILSTGFLPNGSKVKLSRVLDETYFGDVNLKKRVDEYLESAYEIFKMSKHSDVDILIEKVDRLSELLLLDIDRVVMEYQEEGEEKLKDLRWLEVVTWVLIIIVLLLEVIFIFQPLTREIVDLYRKNESILNNLENEVLIRTMKLEDANVKLKDLALHDPLTGLRNRLTLEKDVERAISHERDHKAPYAVLMFDIDWFKDVNDTYGHDIGDRVIKEISKILKEAVRENDKVYRAGGEEFVILLNRIDYTDVSNIAEKIRKLIEQHVFSVDDISFSKTISCGLYHSSIIEGENVDHVLKLVDRALYKSKLNGRNRVTNVSLIHKK